MKKWLVGLFILFLIFPFVNSEDSKMLPIVYCEHMGYTIKLNIEDNTIECIFDENSKCDSFKFYNKECMQDKAKSLPLIRKEGEAVYLEFEKCEGDLIPSETTYLLEQPICKKPNLINRILDFFKNIWS